MSNPKIKLSYFDVEARGEPIRLALHIADVPFEDHRIKKWDDFQDMKQNKKFKFNKIPVMEINGIQFAQQRAILRYVGKLSGLYPTDQIQALSVDEMVDLVEDLFILVDHSVGIEDHDDRKKARQILQNQDLPKFLELIEDQLKQIPTQFIVQDLSIADLWLYTMLRWIDSGKILYFEYDIQRHPILFAYYQRVKSNPKIQEWNDSHPFNPIEIENF